MAKPAKKKPEQQLRDLRKRIDALDDQLIALVLKRTGIIRKVAQLKAANWPNDCHIRPGREGEMHARIAKKFAGTGFSPRAAVALWRQLIGSATNVESPLHIAFLAAQPQHHWLAREYFGPAAELTAIASPAMVAESNVLLLPAPDAPAVNWWRLPLLHKKKPLHIFARLPLVDEELPGDLMPAVALATVTPEPSGDDVSYFALHLNAPQQVTLKGTRILNHGSDYLIVLDGFVTLGDPRIARLRKQFGEEVVSLRWLGAHPRPLVLEA